LGPGPILGTTIIAPGRAAKPPTVREAHLKNEEYAREKASFFLVISSFFYAQELVI